MANDKNAFYVAHIDVLLLIKIDFAPIGYHKTNQFSGSHGSFSVLSISMIFKNNLHPYSPEW
jgi:hypothetical protein